MNATEETIKESLVGKVSKAKATGGHYPNREELLKPLEGPKSVIPSFCTGCGWYLEYDQEGAEILANSAGIKLPTSFTGMFFKTASCSLCDGEDKTISLEKIEDI